MKRRNIGLFDASMYGIFLRSYRRKAGFKRAQDFCASVEEQTGLTVNKETLYRIENGIQSPTIEQLIAFSMTLHPGESMEKAWTKDGVFLSIEETF